MAWLSQKKEPRGGDAVLHQVTTAIEQVMGHPARPPVSPAARLGADLGLSSIAVARLAGLLQKSGGGKPLPFHTLFVKPDGTMLHDIRVSDVVAFLARHVDKETP